MDMIYDFIHIHRMNMQNKAVIHSPDLQSGKPWKKASLTPPSSGLTVLIKAENIYLSTISLG